MSGHKYREVSRRELLMMIAVPPLLAVALVSGLWTFGFWIQQTTPAGHSARSLLEVAFDVQVHFISKVWTSGPLGAALYVVHYIGGFGIIVALSVLARYRFSRKQALAFWATSTATILGYYVYFWVQSSGVSTGALVDIEARDIDHRWYMYLFTYSAYALPVAIVLGVLGALLIERIHTQRHWLARGMCPKCHYDLQGKTDAGCPECGWNRPSPAPPAVPPPTPTPPSSTTS